MASYRPKNTIMFPNQWAVDSFLLRLKRSSGWDFFAFSNGTQFKLSMERGGDYILIGLLRSRGNIELAINGEKLNRGHADKFWSKIYEFAGRYKC